MTDLTFDPCSWSTLRVLTDCECRTGFHVATLFYANVFCSNTLIHIIHWQVVATLGPWETYSRRYAIQIIKSAANAQNCAPGNAVAGKLAYLAE